MRRIGDQEVRVSLIVAHIFRGLEAEVGVPVLVCWVEVFEPLV